MNRKKSSAFEDLYDIAAMLPWWVSLLIAVFAYVICHAIAALDIVTPTDLNVFGQSAGLMFVKVLASFGQYLLPIIFLFGAAASAIAQAKGRGRSSASPAVSTGGLPYQPYRSEVEPKLGLPNQRGADIYPMWKSEDNEIPNIPVDVSNWNPELLSALEWKRFEEVCAGLFERLGFAAKVADFGPDGGIDIQLSRPPSQDIVAIVQCKSRGTSKVGVKVVRELHGVMTSARVTEGILVTTSFFSDEAQGYARANHIDLMDGARVLTSIHSLHDEQQASLLRLATAGDYTTPTCPSCGVKMKERRAKADGKPFWGCVNYPRCRSIINIAKA